MGLENAMPETIAARHLAPMIGVPRGSRVVRGLMVAVETVVDIPRMDPSSLAPFDIPPSPYGSPIPAVVDQGGRTWVRTGSARDLLKALASGNACGSLLGSPFAPWGKGASPGGTPNGTAEELRTVAWDGREAAASEARRMASRDLLLAGEDAYARWRGPVYALGETGGPPVLVALPRVRLADGMSYVAAPQRIGGVAEAVAKGDRFGKGPMPAPEWGRRHAGMTGPDDDIRLMAAAFAFRVHERLDRILRRTEAPAAFRQGLRERHERLLPWRMRSELGMVGPGEAGALLDEVASACAEVRRTRCDYPETLIAADYVRDVARPALASAAVPGDDAEALAGLTP